MLPSVAAAAVHAGVTGHGLAKVEYKIESVMIKGVI